MKEEKTKARELIVCRCMEVTEAEIREVIRQGARSFDSVKRVTRAGMGLCQGRTCQQLVERLIAEETRMKIGELPPISIRPPLRPIRLEAIAGMEK